MPETNQDSSQDNKRVSDSGYQSVIRALTKRRESPALLTQLMKVAEGYRQKRKLGWSRPWNKYGLRTFQSFKLNAETDMELFRAGAAVLQALDDVPESALEFVKVLLSAPEQLMGFVFLSEYTENDSFYETVTLSIGRKNQDSARHRDRFDVVLDAPIENMVAMPLSRVRVFVDPYLPGVKEPVYCNTVDSKLPKEALELFAQLAHGHCNWAESKVWSHWTSKYVEYFGDRTCNPAKSHFPTRSLALTN